MKLTTLDRLAHRAHRPPGKMVLAHGVFDVVHPGHIRHLQWAKAQGDVLVCSVTSDRYVNKGPNRPWVPELLRAENVAALECVDHVVINDADSAIPVIEALRPDVYVKGYEYRYSSDARTEVEEASVRSVGGRCMYSPNDVVYSSTELGPPGLVIPDFSGLRVHVIGDAIRDVYTQAKCLGAASKSPTLVYEKGESQEWAGGATVVAKHCESAGAQVTLWAKGETVKERIIVEGVKVIEFHRRAPIEPWRDPVLNEPVDVVIFADFGHGAIDAQTIASVRDGYPRALFAADSQTSGTAWGNILNFADCDLLFANEREARFALRDWTSPIEDICAGFYAGCEAEGIFLKRGADGLDIRGADGLIKIFAYATQPIVDPIGAGDALLAYATLTYAVTKDLELAGQIGSLAAAEACAHLGNMPVTLDAVKARCRPF
jgi:rfaE bifunctional protein nucleotidyltransferase chain/domain